MNRVDSQRASYVRQYIVGGTGLTCPSTTLDQYPTRLGLGLAADLILTAIGRAADLRMRT